VQPGLSTSVVYFQEGRRKDIVLKYFKTVTWKPGENGTDELNFFFSYFWLQNFYRLGTLSSTG